MDFFLPKYQQSLCVFFNGYKKKLSWGKWVYSYGRICVKKNHVRRNLPPIFVQQFTPNWWCGLVYSYTSIRVSMNLSTLIFFYLTFSYHEAYVSKKNATIHSEIILLFHWHYSMGESQMFEMTHIGILVKVILIGFFVPKIDKFNSPLKFQLKLRSNGLTPPIKLICTMIMAFFHKQSSIIFFFWTFFINIPTIFDVWPLPLITLP